jgi:predicted RNA binding protein YcfA (HicA-like mRNA interferase family)
MPKIPGVNHLRAVRALEKAGFKILRQGKHIVMSDGSHFITIPRHNPVDALTMGGIVKDTAAERGGISELALVTGIRSPSRPLHEHIGRSRSHSPARMGPIGEFAPSLLRGR